MRKRTICMLVAILLILPCLLIIEVNASQIPVDYDIDYWYSNVDEMGIWGISSISVYVGSNSSQTSLSVANLKSYLSTAMTSWSVTKISISYASSQNNAKLGLGGITRAEATSISIPSNVVGVTSFPTQKQIARLYYSSSEKALYSITRAEVLLIESTQTSTVAGAKKVLVHEMGHALGYYGHYDNGRVMTTYYEDITSLTPSTDEKNHLGQMY